MRTTTEGLSLRGSETSQNLQKPMIKVYRVARIGWTAFLFAVLRSQHARAVTMDADALRLEYGSESSEISLGKIESTEIKSGWIWSRVQLRHDGGESVVSGLSSDDAQDFAKALESTRTRWWQRELAPQIGIIRSVCDGLAQLAEPATYLTHSAFDKFRNEAESAAGPFTGCWPNALSGTPEFRMLKVILDFLEDPDRFRTQASNAMT